MPLFDCRDFHCTKNEMMEVMIKKAEVIHTLQLELPVIRAMMIMNKLDRLLQK